MAITHTLRHTCEMTTNSLLAEHRGEVTLLHSHEHNCKMPANLFLVEQLGEVYLLRTQRTVDRLPSIYVQTATFICQISKTGYTVLKDGYADSTLSRYIGALEVRDKILEATPEDFEKVLTMLFLSHQVRTM